MQRLVPYLRVHDPGGYALRRAGRVALVMPAVFAFALFVVDDRQVATFAAFGCFAQLALVDFPGSRSGRLGGYVALALAGAVLVALGTLTSRPAWLAVCAMAVAGFAVLFAGALSAATAAAGRAALLTFILPVTLAGGPSAVLPRLAGWGLAVAASVPAAMLLWPPRQHRELRRRVARTCDALAERIGLLAREHSALTTAATAGGSAAEVLSAEGLVVDVPGGVSGAEALPPDVSGAEAPGPGSDGRARVRVAMAALRETFRATVFRPVGLTTGSRLLVRLVVELEWLCATTADAGAELVATPRSVVGDLGAAGAGTILASASALGASSGAHEVRNSQSLEESLAQLAESRREFALRAATTLAGVPASAQGGGPPAVPVAERAATVPGVQSWHGLGYAVERAGRTVAAIAAADARPLLARLTGRRVPAAAGEFSAAGHLAAGHLDPHSVWLHNSARGAAGLAVAVLLAKTTGAQHAFWIVLGAMSVLRSNALATGSTALRALAGTIAGFAVGAPLLVGLGTNQDVLWLLLPVAVFVAGFAPDAISFTAGQAAFTVVVIVLFNLIVPTGWDVGLVRVEDIVLGCVASLAVGVLFWPRGASTALGTAIADGYRDGVAYLSAAVGYLSSAGSPPSGEHSQAAAANVRLDDALREYLAERGTKRVALENLTRLTNGATRLALAADAITSMRSATVRRTPSHAPAALQRAIDDESRALCAWYRRLADALSDARAPVPDVPAASGGSGAELVADLLVPNHEVRLRLWTSGYLDDLAHLRSRLVGPVAQLRAPHATESRR